MITDKEFRAKPLVYWLRKRFIKRPLSHSQLESIKWSEDEWFENYILEAKKESNPAMRFGSLVGDSIGTFKSMVPQLVPPGVKEYEMRGYISDDLGDIHMIGFADHYCNQTFVLHENKTSDNRKKWNKKSVDEHTQLTMYALLLHIQDKIKPDDIKMQLNYIPVRIVGTTYRLSDPPEVISFATKRTNTQVIQYVGYVKEVVKKMDKIIIEKYESRKPGLRK